MSRFNGLVQQTVQRHNGGAQLVSFIDSMIQIESSGDPRAYNAASGASGLLQQTKANWIDFGNGGDRFNPAHSIDAGVRFAMSNGRAMRKVLGREPTAGEYYLAHFSGQGGACSILRASASTPLSQIMSAEAIKDNKSITFRGKSFAQFTAGDLRAWAEHKMGARIPEAAAYNERYAAGDTTSDEDAVETERRRRQLREYGYSEEAIQQMGPKDMLGILFLQIVLNIFDASSPVPAGRGIEDNRAPTAPSTQPAVTPQPASGRSLSQPIPGIIPLPPAEPADRGALLTSPLPQLARQTPRTPTIIQPA